MSKFSNASLPLFIVVSFSVASQAPVLFQNYPHVCPEQVRGLSAFHHSLAEVGISRPTTCSCSAEVTQPKKYQSLIQKKRSQASQRPWVQEDRSHAVASPIAMLHGEASLNTSAYLNGIDGTSASSLNKETSVLTRPGQLTSRNEATLNVTSSKDWHGAKKTAPTAHQKNYDTWQPLHTLVRKGHVAWLAVIQLRRQFDYGVLFLIVVTIMVFVLACSFYGVLFRTAAEPSMSAHAQQQHQQRQQMHGNKHRPWWEQGTWDVQISSEGSEIGSYEIFPASELGVPINSKDRMLVTPLIHSAKESRAIVFDLGKKPRLQIEMHRTSPPDGPGSLEVTVHKLLSSNAQKFGREWKENILVKIDVPLCGGRSGFPGGGRVAISRPDGTLFGSLVRTRKGGYTLTPSFSKAQVLTFAGSLAKEAGRSVTVIGPRGELVGTTEACSSAHHHGVKHSHYVLCISSEVDASTVLCGIIAIDALENLDPYEDHIVSY